MPSLGPQHFFVHMFSLSEHKINARFPSKTTRLFSNVNWFQMPLRRHGKMPDVYDKYIYYLILNKE